MDFEEALVSVLRERNLGFHLNEPQKECLLNVTAGRHVFCVLPTGFGKSVCYQLAPLIACKMSGTWKAALVISPLVGLMKTQVAELNENGIKATYMHAGMSAVETEGVKNCDSSVYYASPELVQGRHWSTMLTTSPWKERLCIVACDEAHCISQWGEDFRPAYKQVQILRSLAPRGCSFLALTATATEQVAEDIKKALLLPADTVEIVCPPDRPNIHVTIKTGKDLRIIGLVREIIDDIKNLGYRAGKTIVYCRSLKSMNDVYEELFIHLGEDVHPSGIKGIDYRVIDKYFADAGPESKDRILKTFVKRDSKIRCLVATIAFGMGMQIPDVRRVLHWECSHSLLSYWQEIGRAGRDRQPARAVMFATGKSLGCPHRTNSDMKEFGKLLLDYAKEGHHVCIRKTILERFYQCGQMQMNGLSLDCCSNCDLELKRHEGAAMDQ